MAISSDNATNNDTMMEGLELLLAGDRIEFGAEEARVHCMPHCASSSNGGGWALFQLLYFTSLYQLIISQLLKSIGAFKDDKKGSNSAYRDSVTTPISREHDDNAMGYEEEVNEDLDPGSVLSEVLTAIEKVSIG